MSVTPVRLPGLVRALVLRAVLLAVILAALLHLLLATHYYATALVLALCGLWIIADLATVVARAERAAEGFLEALSAGSLETPPRSLLSVSLHLRYQGLLRSLRGDRRQQLQQRDYLQTLLDTVPAALLVVDVQGTVALVNRAAHTLLPRPLHSLAELPLPGAGACELALLAPGMHRIVRLASGRPLLASAARFWTPDGGSRRLICLQRLAGDLDAVELKAWDDMARVLTHEMMSSLTPIASLSQSLDSLLRRGGSAEEVRAALESISRRSQGLMRFVERYRQVADLPPPRLQPLAVGSLLTGVERLVRPAFEQAGAELKLHAAPEAVVACDPDLLEQALINLLRNALDAVTAETHPLVEIVCGIEEDRCLIDICDNGPGLSELAQEQIFVPFFTTKPGGSGVGLSLARRIVAGHGGQLSLQPEGTLRGAVFRLSLPLSGRTATVPDARSRD